MTHYKAEDFTNEDFLKAKEVLECKSADLGFFNPFYGDLLEYISEKYSIREDPSEDPYDYESKREITKKFKIMTYVDGDMTEISIGEFILKSLQDWDPETVPYLALVHNLLVKWGARVPVKRTVEQNSHMYQLRSLFAVIKASHPELEIDELPFDEKLQTLNAYLPDEYKKKALNLFPIFQPANSLDNSLSGDEDSDTFLDKLEGTYSSDDERKNPHIIVEKAYSQFKRERLQNRTAIRIRLYMTVKLIKINKNSLSFDDFRKLATQYPDFIVDIDWIEQIYLTNTANHPDFAFSTRLPSQKQQAEYLGIDYHSYCNSILRYKQRIFP